MRTLTVTITPEHGCVAEIDITDMETSVGSTFYVGGYNTDDEKAMQIGYELIGWAEAEITKLMEEK